ncbi:MAG: GspE/PulE family protein, partial [Oscillospiraceae bacterium]
MEQQPMNNLPIGKLLVKLGFISDKQLEDALNKQKMSGGKMIGDVLLEMNLVSEAQLANALSIRLKVPYVDLSSVSIDTEAVSKIEEETAREKCVFAYQINHNRLLVATNDPINFYIFEDLKVKTGMEIVPMISTKTAINDAIGRYYSNQAVDSAVSELNSEQQVEQETVSAESADRVDSAPIVKIVNMLLLTAFRERVTDIHIEPFKTRTRIRYRIDGELVEQEKMSMPIAYHNSIITRIKILGGMNIAERRIPLDGRYGTVIDGVNQDFRISTIPCVYGEKCVIRLLSSADEKTRKITDLGMTDYNYEMFKQIIRCPNGVMLVTGPTGSGKSTTLYATLGELSQPNVNIITVEDPVEKKIDGVNQCQINAKAGMTFAAALRSILRQDPDIIMVGEIRDGETADIAIRAAITG